MKPYYRRKGNYLDGRMKIIIEKLEKKKIISKTLPLPEIMWLLLGQVEKGDISKEKQDS